jgi:hypothetical protein
MAPHCVSTIHPTRRSTPDVQPETRKCLARLRGGRRTRLNSVGARLLGSPATKSAKNQICFPEGGAAPALSGAMYFGADRRIWPAEPRGSINRAEASPVIGHTRSFGRAQTIAWIRVPRGAPSGRQGSALAHIALRTRGRSRRRTRPGRRVRAGGLCAFPAANSFAPWGWTPRHPLGCSTGILRMRRMPRRSIRCASRIIPTERRPAQTCEGRPGRPPLHRHPPK